jgi:hypothetical protein
MALLSLIYLHHLARSVFENCLPMFSHPYLLTHVENGTGGASRQAASTYIFFRSTSAYETIDLGFTIPLDRVRFLLVQ